jgi:ABC-type Fe3+/spermidine/putrescine transport system ATPase subunit
MEICALKNVTKTFDTKSINALNDINLTISNAEIVFVLGPSGSGKTTLRRLIEEEIKPDSGQILFNKKNLAKLEELTPTLQQTKVADLLISPIAVEKRALEIDFVRELITFFNLEYLHEKKFHELSTGQAQRALLAHALVKKPNLLILDEPFSNLDDELREALNQELMLYLKENKIACLYITHHQEDALSYADRMICLDMGNNRQTGTPEQILFHPIHTFVAKFVGRHNLQTAKIKFSKESITILETPFGDISVNKTFTAEQKYLTISFSPNALRTSDSAATFNKLKIKYKKLRGPFLEIILEEENKELSFYDLPQNYHRYNIGEVLHLELDVTQIHYFK